MMRGNLARDYPDGFAALTRHLLDDDMPVTDLGADVCGAAVLFAVGHLHPRTMAALATAVVGRTALEGLSPALCTVAGSQDPDRDPDIRPAFEEFLVDVGLLRSADQGWAVLARVGARHGREIAEQIVSGAVDPLEGAVEIAECFNRYLPESERRRLCDQGEPAALERSTCLTPFVAFTRVFEDLYEAGYNVNPLNDELSYAPSNVLSPREKADRLTRLRSRYIETARASLEASR